MVEQEGHGFVDRFCSDQVVVVEYKDKGFWL